MSDAPHRDALPDAIRRRALEAYRRLRALAIDLYRSQGGTPGEADSFDLAVTVELGKLGIREALDRHGESMLRDLVRKTEDLTASLSAYRAGRAYCFFCQKSSCAHAEPPSTVSAFAGYSPTGRPRWVDFTSLALEWRDPRIDSVFAKRPSVIAINRPGPALLAELLPDFRMGPSVYDLLGEVVIGPLPFGVPARGREAESVATVQAVLCLGRDGESELRLNVIGKVASSGDVRVFLDNGGDENLARALASAELDLDTLNRRARGARRARRPAIDPSDAVDSILRRLARRVEQIYRQRSRRTVHAQVRTDEGARPTRKALDDARQATADHVLVDERGGTLVVLGSRGRIHVFSPQGRLVTSISAGREEVQRRIERRRWRVASAAEVAAFKGAISPAAADGGP